MSKAGIVICSRSDSKRLPCKPFIPVRPLISGVRQFFKDVVDNDSVLYHLVNTVKDIADVVVAIPENDACKHYYHYAVDAKIFVGDNSPLHRTAQAAILNDFDPIVRITHDKIFIDTDSLVMALAKFVTTPNADYFYSSRMIPGTGFEIFSRKCLQKACKRHEYVEHLSYALKEAAETIAKETGVADNVHDFYPDYSRADHRLRDSVRLLIDYKKDLDFIKYIFSQFAKTWTPNLFDVLDLIKKNTIDYSYSQNLLPEVTVYSCAYNEQDYVKECIDSVINQSKYVRLEYIFIDDCSTDNTAEIVQDYFRRLEAVTNLRLVFKRNETNVGLSSSSNIALDLARGKYICRLDADDYFMYDKALFNLVSEIKNQDAVYPSYFDEASASVLPGEVRHHAGGSLFLTRMLREVRFVSGLRQGDSQDLIKRLSGKRIRYFKEDKPTFFYRNKPNSLSKVKT